MTTAYTSLLGLALPVTGELSGTWGDTVNSSITSLLDDAIAGTTTLSSDADVTLSNNDGTADTSRQAILLWTAGGTVTRTVIAPALSKIYTVINASSSTQSIKVTGPGPTTGVTIVKGESALIAWNGSDFVKVSNSGGSFTTQDLTVTGNTILGDAITDTTTLNAQTRFLSLATLGYSNMTGPAATSLSTTAPAFLYSGATTYTVADVSGGTKTHAPIISLGQTSITNATTATTFTNASTLYIGGTPNASTNITFTRPYALYLDSGTTASATVVTYTNAATLYIAGAPTAGSNVTLTDPLALSVAAGTSYFAGNVGIGTSSPQAKLHINSGAGSTQFRMGPNNTSSDRALINYNSTTNRFTIDMSGNDSVIVDGSGNVGLGVTPSVWNSNFKALQISTGGSLSAAVSQSSFVDLGGNFYQDSGGTERYIASSSANKYRQYAGAHSWYTAASGTAGNAITFTQAMTLDASGNLGVGATSIPAGFRLYASGGSMLLDNNTAFRQKDSAGTNTLIFVLSSSNNLEFGSGSHSGGMTITTGNSNITFTANSAERMRIDSSGNVGIGTSSPAVTLSVNGTIGVFGGSLNGSIGSPQLYRPASDTLAIATGAVERMRIDSSGNLGIGTTNIQERLTVQNNIQITNSASNLSGIYFGTNANPAQRYSYIESDGRSTGYINFNTNALERARIDSSGNLLVGTTSTLISTARRLQVEGVVAAVFKGTGSGSECLNVWQNFSTGNNVFIEFDTDTSPTGRGTITYNRAAGLVAYNTTSDYRAKDIYGSIADSGLLIDSVPVYMGKMKGATQERPMFIAHETPAYAHTGEKDAVDKDGNPVYQQMDTSALVPVMWAEIQSLRKRITALESN